MCAKRNKSITDKIISKRLSEGRCDGDKENYKPWANIQEVNSNGIVGRHYSNKTNRLHHLTSELETNYFYLLEWSDKVIDIKERYALKDIDLAMKIAVDRNINYPVDPVSKTPLILTSDFMITFNDNNTSTEVVRELIHSKELSKKRVLEVLEIKRAYWEEKGFHSAL